MSSVKGVKSTKLSILGTDCSAFLPNTRMLTNDKISPFRNVSVQVHLGYSRLYIPGRNSTKRGWHCAHDSLVNGKTQIKMIKFNRIY